MRALVLAILAGLLHAGDQCTAGDVSFPAPAFSLTDQDGNTVTNDDLRGKVWVASFVFTRCTAGCPQITSTMKDLQEQFRDHPDFRLVTFTVDPEHDSPQELKEYAKLYQADPRRWSFLTGNKNEIKELVKSGFFGRLDADEKQRWIHEQRLFLVDRRGIVRRLYWGLPSSEEHGKEIYEKDQADLKDRLKRILGPKPGPVHFPTINAILNGLSGVLILIGIIAIKTRRVGLHKICMLSALVVSIVFLASYLYYHLVIQKGAATRFSDRAPDAPPWVALTYLFILATHTVLAAIVAPMALVTAYFGLRDRLSRHVLLGKLTWPAWLYVSITGVVVYWMLYQLYPSP